MPKPAHLATSEELSEWKAKYGRIAQCTIEKTEGSGEFVTLVIRKPGRLEVSQFELWVDKNPDKAKEILVNSCICVPAAQPQAKEIAKSTTDAFLNTYKGIMELYPVGKAEVLDL